MAAARKRSYSVLLLMNGDTPMHVHAVEFESSAHATIARTFRWAQSLGGGEPRGLVHGSIEPLRNAVRGLPATAPELKRRPDLWTSHDAKDRTGRWSMRWLVRSHTGTVKAKDIPEFVKTMAGEASCSGWVPTTALDDHYGGGTGQRIPERTCTSCLMVKNESWFPEPKERDVCRDCL